MHAKCNRCGADNKPMTDYEFWGRVEQKCEGVIKMDKARKTEIVENKIHDTLAKLLKDHKGEIQFKSKANYSDGSIIIKILD